MAASLSSDDVIEVRVVSPAESSQLLEFLLEHYYREEPLTVGTSPPSQPDQADRDFLLSHIPNQTCLTLRLKESGRIVAAAVAGSKDANEGQHLEEYAKEFVGTKWGRIVNLLTQVELLSNVCARYQVSHALHIHALGVDASMRGQSLGARVIKAMEEQARKLGYPLICLDCTSIYSAQLVKRLGYQLVSSLKYAEYTNEEGIQLIQVPPPHERVQTYALKL
ncbi:arylalkylamine N-acetyltransferase-like 2 [Drosophila tropicalis]|uniref:arylalkylamine N-acetyltransferase-like 2 n=1 Tax=Drosophila tropicalis TaxID=46794 RepID=UPI0035AC1615